MACLPSVPESLREAVPRRRNLRSALDCIDREIASGAHFWEVESGIVVRSNDRTLIPRSSLILIVSKRNFQAGL
jgi:hypothetical protein